MRPTAATPRATGRRPTPIAARQVWNLAWNTAGQIHTVTDPNSTSRPITTTRSGRLSNIVNANSDTQASYTYDSADRIQTYTDSQGYVLTYAYDNLDRVTSITYPDGTTDLYDYTFQSGPLRRARPALNFASTPTGWAG